MQENGKLFSFLVIVSLFLTALHKPDRDAICQTIEKYHIDTVNRSVKSGDNVTDASVSSDFPTSLSSFKTEMF
jgi:hypothetical protein